MAPRIAKQPNVSVRLAEDPLRHRSLHAIANVVEALAQSDELRRRGTRAVRDKRDKPEAPRDSLERLAAVPFAVSTLTQLLQEGLGGTCLTLALVSVCPGDFVGSKATLQLAQALAKVHNFPVTNTSTIQGIRWRHLAQLTALRNEIARRRRGRSSMSGSSPPSLDQTDARPDTPDDEAGEAPLPRILEVNRVLREDRQQLLSAMSALKSKYRSLFDGEIEIRKELLACEQEKLALSRAFVQFQQEKMQQVQSLDAAKFEVEHKLIEAEQMVLEIQQDDGKKAAQIEELCGKLGELVRDKATLAEDLARAQAHARDKEQELEREAKKNQQLSLELIMAVSQKHKLQAEREAAEAEQRAGGGRLASLERDLDALKAEHHELQAKCAPLVSQLEEARKDLVRKELEMERLALASKTERLQLEQATRSADQQLSAQSDKLASALEVERAAFNAEKRALALQLERALVESKQLAKDKEGLVTAWMAKSSENEELRVRNERLRSEAQAQVELFRSKLARLDDVMGSKSGGGSSAGRSHAVEELVQSYQSREKTLRSELERCEEDKLALLRRLHSRSGELLIDRSSQRRGVGARRSQATAEDDSMGEEDEDDTGPVVDTDDAEGLVEELGRMRECVAASQQRVADEMYARASQALAVTELERTNEQLARDCEQYERRCRESERSMEAMRRELETGDRARDADAAAAIAKMHETLMRQVDEVRRLTLAAAQQQQQLQAADVSNQSDRGFASTSGDSSSQAGMGRDQLKALRDENRQLTTKLRDGKAQWTKLLEETERRCAALVTKNVMLAEENQHLRHRVKVRASARVAPSPWLTTNTLVGGRST